ncbi:pectinesterase inhibitor 12-like [Musa acuminata AAA Group]|uniref:pectinesterase inhibitor 12-like n=1 Tax=Musa acuminata AAA Group TaxID=214697 RepID=UPI0031E34FFD
MATHLFIFFSLSSSLLPPASATSSPGGHGPCKDAGDIASICSHTDYVSLCINAAHTYGHAYAVIDAASLFGMHIHMASDRTKTVKDLASHLAAKPSSSKSVKQALVICIKMYDDALDDLVKGSDAIKARDEGTANSMLSGVISYYSTCDDAFTEIPAPNPLCKQDGTLMHIVSNALALAHLILSKGP